MAKKQAIKTENGADAKPGEKPKSEKWVMDRCAFMQTSILTAAAMVTTSAAGTSWPTLVLKEGIEMNNLGAYGRADALSSLRLDTV